MSKITNLKKFLFNNKTYVMVFLIFAVALAYGRNYNIDDAEKTILFKVKQLDHQTQGVYDLNNSQNEIIIDNLISTNINSNYRLFFDLYAGLDKAPKEETKKKLPVDIVLSDDFGHEQLIASSNLLSGQHEFSIETIFNSESNFRHLTVRKTDPDYSWVASISNIALHSLKINNQEQLKHLMPTIKGDSDFRQAILSNNSAKSDQVFTFNKKNQKIGQIFTANQDTMSTVNLQMEFVGTGGSGNYTAEIYQYDESRGIAPDRLGYYSFNLNQTTDELADKSKAGFSTIPLAVKLEVGKKYVFLISNSGVSFNSINTLKVFGYKSDFGDNKMFMASGRSHKTLSGSLNFTIYGAHYIEFTGKKVLSNAIIQDLGDGNKLYTYRQRGNFSDYFDIFETSDQSPNKTGVFYDNVLRGVSAGDKNETSFTYKIDTIYPYSDLSVSLEQPGGGFIDSVVSYSFDNASWYNLEMKKSVNDPNRPTNKFEKTIKTDGRTAIFFLKITYDEENKKEKADNINRTDIFGIKNIIISANLK